MAFTYDPALSLGRDRIRFHVNDTVENNGPKPDKGNFSDAELDALLTQEGTYQLAIAAAYETLGAAWASKTTFSAQNGSFQRSDASKRYLELANNWRERYGDKTESDHFAGSVSVAREDSYSD